MVKNMFVGILQKDEEVIWSEGINKKAYILKNLIINIICAIWFGIVVGALWSGISLTINSNFYIDLFFEKLFPIAIIVSIIMLLIFIIRLLLEANNIFFAITNKRIIKRSGVFSNKFVHYSLKNIGNVEIIGSIWDGKGENASAKLFITVKDFHNNMDASGMTRLIIDSLNNAYNAYRFLSEKIEGNNDVIRIKHEK